MSCRRRIDLATFGLVAALVGCADPHTSHADRKPDLSATVQPFALSEGYQHFIQVETAGRAYRVAYFPGAAGNLSDNRLNVYVLAPGGIVALNRKTGKYFFLHSYENTPDDGTLNDVVDIWKRPWKQNFVLVGPLGTYGSSGEAGDHVTVANVDALDAVLTELAARFHADSIALTGPSAMAPTVLALASKRPDIHCVSISSGSFDAPALYASQGIPRGALGNMIVASSYLNALASRSHPPRIVLVAAKEDKVVPYQYTEAFAADAKRLGLDVTVEFELAPPPDHHVLDASAIRNMLQCHRETVR